MIREELYIEGKRVDLSTEPITLQYRSNLLGDIDSITSSNSLTIRLPKTPNNNDIMQFADTLIINSTYQRQWYNAIYYRNGVQMIKGRASLLSVDKEGYEVCLAWGIFEKLESWLNSNMTLRDLPLDAYTSIVAYSNALFPRPKPSRVGYIRYDNGLGLVEGTLSWIFPFVNVAWVWNDIMVDNGIYDMLSVVPDDEQLLQDYFLSFNDDLVKETYINGAIQSFPVSQYIPAIGQVEFFKSICHMFGWYLEVGGDGDLMLTTFENFSDRTRALDWSDKLVTDGNIPESVEFNYNDYARNNWMRYKKDENALRDVNAPSRVDADGAIFVLDSTLEENKDLFTLPFAATDGSYIRQYQRSVNERGETETDFIRTEPRIIPINPNSPVVELYFTEDMKFSSIIPNRYAYYQEVMYNPVVISVKLRLTEFDLRDLDFTRPVYFSRYGAYFAIIEINTSGEFSEAKLLKLV